MAPRIDLRVARRVGSKKSRTGLLALIAPSALVLFALSACGSDSPEADSTSAAATLAGTSWTLASAQIDGKDVAAVASATLAFDTAGTALSGSTGCNQFSGTYKQSGSDLTITLGPMTLAACTDAKVTLQETAIVAQLPKVASFSADKQLTLKDSSGKVLLTYDKGLSTIAGTSWKATGVNNGNGGVESNTVTETVTAQFGDNGAMSGLGGCNNYNATYALSGSDGISITKVTSTKMACAEDAMTLEGQYFAALDKVATYTLSGDTLTLRDSDGNTQVTYSLTS